MSPGVVARTSGISRPLALNLAIAILATLSVSTVGGAPATASGGIFVETFTEAAVLSPSDWTVTTRSTVVTGVPETAPVSPCLTAGKVSGATTLTGCAPSAIDSPGSGALRLTGTDFNQAAAVEYARPLQFSDGLDISFILAMHGSTTGTASGIPSGLSGNHLFSPADGIAFFLRDGANSSQDVGGTGGNLGYGGSPGLPGGLIGIGFDRRGNYPTGKHGCSGQQEFDSGAVRQDHIVVRGPDLSDDRDGSCGFAVLPTITGGRVSAAVPVNPKFSLQNDPSNRAGRARYVRIVIDRPDIDNPRISIYLSNDATPVAEGVAPVLTLDQPAIFARTETFRFGFGASTGSLNNIHEVWGLDISLSDPANPPPSVVGVSASTTPVLDVGVLPTFSPPEGVLQDGDGTVVPLSATSPRPGEVRYAAEGVTAAFRAVAGSSASVGLVVAPDGEIRCNICYDVLVGQVIEAWMFSEPRIVAAHRTQDDPCQTFTIPLGGPLDGGGPMSAGRHTLQLALPTATGMQSTSGCWWVARSRARYLPGRV